MASFVMRMGYVTKVFDEWSILFISNQKDIYNDMGGKDVRSARAQNPRFWTQRGQSISFVLYKPVGQVPEKVKREKD